MLDRRLRRPRGRDFAALAGAALLLVAGLAPATNIAAATIGIDVQLPLGHQIRGVISSPTGLPVAGADVNASTDNDSVSAVTAADGSFVLHAVADGTYHVFADDSTGMFDPRYYGVPDSVADAGQAADVVVHGDSVDHIDVTLGAKAAAGISGTVRDPGGQPVGGVVVSAAGENASGQAKSAANGTYRIGGLSAGDYRLFIEPPDGSIFFSGPYVDGTVGGAADAPTMVTVADVDTSDVDVALVTGRTISGHVSIARPADVVAVANGDRSSQALVDANGNYVIRALAPGIYQVVFGDVRPGLEQTEIGGFPYGAYGSGGALVSQLDAASIDVTDADATLDPVALPRGTDIVGQVTDGKNGLPNAFLFVCDVNGELGCGSATSQSDGSFRIRHVPTGSYTIFASVTGRVAGFYQPNGFTIDDFAAGTVNVVSGGPDAKGIKIAVPIGGSVSGRITGQSGEPIVGAVPGVFPFGIPENWRQPLTGSDGQYVMTGIPTNEYSLFVGVPASSDYIRGYYRAGAPGNYTADVQQATTFRVIEDRDHQAPTITFRDPAVTATDVPSDTTVSVRFAEPVENVTTATMQLRDPHGRLVAAAVTFTPNERTARLTPNIALQPGTKYRLTMSSAIVDWSGNHFAGASWSFTTAP